MKTRIDFSVATGSCIQPKLQKDWESSGAKAFTFKILEEIEMKADQSRSSFQEDLKALEEMYREKMNLKEEY